MIPSRPAPRAAVAGLALAVAWAALPAGGAHAGATGAVQGGESPADAVERAAVDEDAARTLLERSVRAVRSLVHVGEVTVVTLGRRGPEVSSSSVRVGPMGRVELRRPARWLLGAQSGPTLVRTGAGRDSVAPAGGAALLDVEAALAGRAVSVGDEVELDTGPAVPVVLRREIGPPVQDTLFVDVETGLLVRRETRDADGEVLRVVAFTRLATVPTSAPSAVLRPAGDGVGGAATETAAGTWDLPLVLAGGFQRVATGGDQDMTAARYSDGLSVLSVYRQRGLLDLDALQSAEVVHVAGRDVWTWPGSEPLRMVWTGAGSTWTAVTDAPLEVVEDALRVLPGDLVGHDLPSRLRRGLLRAWDWMTDRIDT